MKSTAAVAGTANAIPNASSRRPAKDGDQDEQQGNSKRRRIHSSTNIRSDLDMKDAVIGDSTNNSSIVPTSISCGLLARTDSNLVPSTSENLLLSTNKNVLASRNNDSLASTSSYLQTSRSENLLGNDLGASTTKTTAQIQKHEPPHFGIVIPDSPRLSAYGGKGEPSSHRDKKESNFRYFCLYCQNAFTRRISTGFHINGVKGGPPSCKAHIDGDIYDRELCFHVHYDKITKKPSDDRVIPKLRLLSEKERRKRVWEETEAEHPADSEILEDAALTDAPEREHPAEDLRTQTPFPHPLSSTEVTIEHLSDCNEVDACGRTSFDEEMIKVTEALSNECKIMDQSPEPMTTPQMDQLVKTPLIPLPSMAKPLRLPLLRPKANLCDLPRELRNRILREVMTVTQDADYRGGGEGGDFLLSLLRVNHRLRFEALEMLQKGNVWVKVNALHPSWYDISRIIGWWRQPCLNEFVHGKCVKPSLIITIHVEPPDEPRPMVPAITSSLFAFNRRSFAKFCLAISRMSEFISFIGIAFQPHVLLSQQADLKIRLIRPLELIRVRKVRVHCGLTTNATSSLVKIMETVHHTVEEKAKAAAREFQKTLRLARQQHALGQHDEEMITYEIAVDRVDEMDSKVLSEAGIADRQLKNLYLDLTAKIRRGFCLATNTLVKEHRVNGRIEGVDHELVSAACIHGFSSFDFPGISDADRALGHYALGIAYRNEGDCSTQEAKDNGLDIDNLEESYEMVNYKAAAKELHLASLLLPIDAELSAAMEEVNARTGWPVTFVPLFEIKDQANKIVWKDSVRLMWRWGLEELRRLHIHRERPGWYREDL